MGKLYVFGIGGTGSRVIRSLVMLAASGVKINAEAIVPIVVDPDFANGDVTRTVSMLRAYEYVRSKLTFNDTAKNEFFLTPIENVTESYFRLKIEDTKNKKFDQFIGFSELSKENKALASMLFSERNLAANMEVGFKGNPNIGSVVLNQFTDSKDFIDFAEAFKPGDKIFIINSIFGGTGASGFPLLLKSLRSLDAAFPAHSAIREAPIGAVTVLPYFMVHQDPSSEICSDSFIEKTKAALRYYEKNVTGNESAINVQYYIGDEVSDAYENHEGGLEQCNDAHFVECAAALSIIDFADLPNDAPVLELKKMQSGKVHAPNWECLEFGIADDVKEVIFKNLSRKTREIVCAPMTRFLFFSKYMHENLMSAGYKMQWAKELGFDDAFLKSQFMQDLRRLTILGSDAPDNGGYLSWLRELKDNHRSFSPYELSKTGKELFSIVNGIDHKNSYFFKKGYDLFDSEMNKMAQKVLKGNHSKEHKFVELFYLVTKDLVNDKYNFG